LATGAGGCVWPAVARVGMTVLEPLVVGGVGSVTCTSTVGGSSRDWVWRDGDAVILVGAGQNGDVAGGEVRQRVWATESCVIWRWVNRPPSSLGTLGPSHVNIKVE
jgi:hypothetical protein